MPTEFLENDIKDEDAGFLPRYEQDFAVLNPDLLNTEFDSTATYASDISDYYDQVLSEAEATSIETAAYNDAFVGGAVEFIQRGKNNDVDPNFNSVDFADELKSFPLESYDYILDANNRMEFERRKQHTIESDAARKVVSETSLLDAPASFAGAAFQDPFLLLPAGAIGVTAKGGVSLMKTTASVGVMGGLSAAGTEVFAQAGDPLRTSTEGAVAISAGTVMSGLLGNVSARMARRGDRKLIQEVFGEQFARTKDAEAEGVAGNVRQVFADMKDGSISSAEFDSALLDKFKIQDKDLLSKLSAGLNTSPTVTMMKFENPEARKLYMQLVETPFFSEADKAGQGSEQSVERFIDGWRRLGLGVVNQNGKFYREYLKRISGTGEEKLSRQQFNEAIGKAMRRGDDAIEGAEIQKAVDNARSVFEKFRKGAKDAGLDGFENEEMKVLFGESWLYRMYDVDKIRASEGTTKSFKENVLMPWARNKVADMDKQIQKAGNKEISKISKQIDELNAANKDKKKVAKLEREIEEIKLKTQRKIDELIELNPEQTARELAQSKYTTLTGGETTNVPFSLPKELLGSANARTLDIHDDALKGWLNDNIDEIMARYSSDMGVNIEMKRKFGSVDRNEIMARMKQSYDDEIQKLAQSGDSKANRKAAKKMTAERDKAVKLIDGVISSLKGQDIKYDRMRRITNAMKMWNFMRLLGKVTISSLSDAHRLIISNGMMRSYGGVLNQAVHGFRGLRKSMALDKKYLGGFLEHVDSERMKFITDIHGDRHIGKGNAFERAMQNLSHFFSRTTLIHTWNNTWKGISAHATQQRLLQAAIDLSKGGDIDKFDTKFLSRIGWSKDDLAELGRIAKIDKEGGSLLLDFDSISLDMHRKYQAAVRKQADFDVVTPTIGDVPLSVRSNPYLGLVFQFKTFALASHNKMLLAGMQQRDAAVASGLLHGVLMGMLSVKIKADMAGRDTSEWDTEQWVMRGVEQSGLIALPMMLNEAVELAAPELPTLYDLMGNESFRRGGGSDFVSRYSLGATGDTIKTALNAGKELSEWDVDGWAKQTRKLMPFQNLWATNILENTFDMKSMFDTINEKIKD